jgi:hypothetical protein
MTLNTNLVENAITTLIESGLFEDCKIVKAFNEGLKEVPLTRPIIAVSLKDCNISERLETEEGIITKKRDVLSSLGTDIYLPLTVDSTIAFSIFDKIATLLIFTKAYSINEASFDSLRYDSNSQALILPANFVFKNTVSA